MTYQIQLLSLDVFQHKGKVIIIIHNTDLVLVLSIMLIPMMMMIIIKSCIKILCAFRVKWKLIWLNCILHRHAEWQPTTKINKLICNRTDSDTLKRCQNSCQQHSIITLWITIWSWQYCLEKCVHPPKWVMWWIWLCVWGTVERCTVQMWVTYNSPNSTLCMGLFVPLRRGRTSKTTIQFV